MSPRALPSNRRRWLPGASLALALFAAATPAYADGSTDVDRAEALFDEGRRLMQQPGKLDEACKTLEKSYLMHDRGDTLLNLAECHTRQGKTATAWAEFDRAIRIGVKVKFKEAIEVAKERRDELAAKLSSLTVSVSPEVAGLRGLVVELNGEILPSERWNKEENRDPGPMQVTAVAKGYKRFSSLVELGNDKDKKTIVVALEKEAPPPAPKVLPPPPPPPPPPPRRGIPVWPFVVGGAGLAMLGVSAAFGVDSLGASDELSGQCGADRKACPSTYDFGPTRQRELTSFGLYVGFGVAGLAAVGAAGIGLGLSAVRVEVRPRTRVQFSPTSVLLQTEF